MTRTTIPARLAAGLALAAALAAPVPAAAQDAGAAAFEKACARCHTVEKVMEWMAAHPGDAERGRWLEAKLARHHARDPEIRARIIGPLESRYRAGAVNVR